MLVLVNFISFLLCISCLVSVIGFGHGGDWIREFFVDKAHLFLRVLNAKWEGAGEEAERIARLLKALGVDVGSRILDVGCGNGRIAVNLAKLGYRVVGVDVSPMFVEDAWGKAGIHGVKDKVRFLAGDALEIDRILEGELFDAAIMYWTTILGYYLDRSSDVRVLRGVRRIVRGGGYLLILNTVSLDLMVLRSGLCGIGGWISEVDDEFLLVENPRFDPKTSTMENTWVFYRRRGRDLEYVDEVSFKLRVYALHEVVEMTGEAGWEFVEAYRDLKTLKPYRPGLSGLNVVFKAVEEETSINLQTSR